jgi:sarcosine oxidase subunit beta
MKTEVAIIGSGITGCSAAYYLAKQGRKVIILEKDNGVGLQASARAAGGVRQQGRTGALHLAMAAVELWDGLSEELQTDLEYVRTGNLVIALDKQSAATLEQETAWEQERGLADVRMITAAACHKMIPGLTREVVAGKHCASDGSANPMLVTPAFARAAQRAGAQILTNTTVTGLLHCGKQVAGLATDQGEFEADFVINAAGPWACKFNQIVACPTPISPGRSQLLITERFPPRLHPWLTIMGSIYLRQVVAGNIIIGLGGLANDTYEQFVDYHSLRQYAQLVCEALPWLEDARLIRAFAGITEYTPDGEPYIGAVPDVAGLFVAAGFHGQGFCVGPMAGKIIADLICGHSSPVSLMPFRPERFAAAGGKFADEAIIYPGEKSSDGD